MAARPRIEKARKNTLVIHPELPAMRRLSAIIKGGGKAGQGPAHDQDSHRETRGETGAPG